MGERALRLQSQTGVDATSVPRTTATSERLSPSEEFYGLHRRPFSLTPDLRFAFNSRSHLHAFEQVTQALRRREGLIVVTGDIGTGKTMLCRTLLETFEARTFLCVVLDPLLNVDELLTKVLRDFGLLKAPQSGRDAAAIPTRHQLIETLQQFLATLIPLNAHAVVMIDEAQQLDPAVLEQIRLLSNFETDEAKLLQIVLVGQPDLEELLKRPDMRQLNQRVARRCELHPLSEPEVGDYIRRRLMVAAEPSPDGRAPLGGVSHDARAATPVEFTGTATAAIARISGGIPRVVNTLCDRALEAGFEKQTRVIDEAITQTAAERLKLAVPPAARTAARPRAKISVAIAATVLGIAAVIWFGWSRLASSGTVGPIASSVPAMAPITTSVVAPTPPAPAPAPVATAGPAAPTAAASRPTNTGAPAAGTYHIAVAAFRTEQRAAAVVNVLKERGLPAYTRIDPSSQWRLVVAGPFKSTDAATAAQRTLSSNGFGSTRIVLDE